MKKIIHIGLLAIAAAFIAGCEEEPVQKNEEVRFTVRPSETSYDYAIVNVKHNGAEDITWYGFLTEDLTTHEYLLINKKMAELLKGGNIPVMKEQERNILLEDLKEDTDYRYIVFGITEEGKLYDNVGLGSCKVATTINAYKLTKTDDWSVSYLGRNEAGDKELIEVKPNKGGRFAWQYISKETVDMWSEEYPDGYELWVDDIYMTTVDALQLFALEQISTIQYNVSLGGDITDWTYATAEGEDKIQFTPDRLASGDYYIVVYGFNGVSHTQTYSVQEITIEEEEATPEYEKWLGTYTFSGEVDATLDNGETERQTRTYNIRIEHYDNNFMYRIHGWECGADVKYDWEEDIMQIDKTEGQFLAFPGYYNNGSLEIRESPMTYITFDGVNTLLLGMYGYAYNTDYKEDIPVLQSETPMALAAPVKEGETTTLLEGLEAVFEVPDSYSIKLEYNRMGYIAWNEYTGEWQTINPPMLLPITITRTESETAAPVIPEPAQNCRRLFNTKRITTDAIHKNYDKLKKMEPEVFERAF